MSHEDNLNPADRELEEALRSLSPTPARVDPVTAAFRAGERSARKSTALWRSIAAAVTVALIGSWMVPASNHSSPPNTFVQVEYSAPAPAAIPADMRSVLAFQQAVRAEGIDALPRVVVPTVRDFDSKDFY